MKTLTRLVAALLLVAGLVALAPSPAEAAPSFEMRADNAFTLRGHVQAEPATVDFPLRSFGFPMLLEANPLDGAVRVVCAERVETSCSRLIRGDRVLTRGEVRVDPGGSTIFLAQDLKVYKGA